MTTSAAHGLSSGQTILIQNIVPAGYNGTYTLLTASGSPMTYLLNGKQYIAVLVGALALTFGLGRR